MCWFISIKFRMNQSKPLIDALFYDKEEIDKELKCPCCSQKFVSPRLLPCGDSICLKCIQFIKDQNSNDFLRCPVCEELHSFDTDKLPKIKLVESLLNKNANEVYRNQDVEQLKEKLTAIKLKTEKLENHLRHPHETIKEHSKSLLNEIDLATEKAHQLINEFHDSLFDQVKQYEKECLCFYDESKARDNETLQEDLKSVESVIYEAKVFFQQKVDYLRKFEIEDNQISRSLIDSDQLIFKIKDKLCLLAFLQNRQKKVCGKY